MALSPKIRPAARSDGQKCLLAYTPVNKDEVLITYDGPIIDHPTRYSIRSLEYIVFLVIVVGLAPPAGRYLARVCQGGHTFLDPVLCSFESLLYRWFGVRLQEEMSAGVYIACFLLFGAGCALLLFLVLMFQRWRPGGHLSFHAHEYGSGGEHDREFHLHNHLAGLSSLAR